MVDGVEEVDPKNLTHKETSFYRVIGPACKSNIPRFSMLSEQTVTDQQICV